MIPNEINNNEATQYIGKMVWAMFPDSKTKIHARLIEIKELSYTLYCGVHNRQFEAQHIARIEE